MPKNKLDFKLNLNFALSDKQRQILEWCEIGNGIQTVAVCTGRQIGKTTIDDVVAIKWCAGIKEYKVGFFLPIYKQCKKVFRGLKKMLRHLGKYMDFNSTDLLITFWNGSTIQFFTCENDSCRGETFDAIIVDEACFVASDIWQRAVQPTVQVSLSKKNELGMVGFCGKVLLTSTPKTKNWFHGIVTKNGKRTVVTRFTSEEGGLIAKEILEEIKTQIPEQAYRNEYLGEFLDSGNGLFKYTNSIIPPEIFKTLPKVGHVAGVDVASKDDWLVLTIQDRSGRVIFQDRWRHMEYKDMLDIVKARLVEYGSPLCYIETNGCGQMPYEYLKGVYSRTKEWTTTASNKTDIITKLQMDFISGAVQIPDEQTLKDELDYFTCEWSDKGNPKFGGSNGFHDDRVMSLAICNFNRDKIVFVSAETFNKPKKSNY
jgi:hypothetical protein